jgi:hypothetical protein
VILNKGAAMRESKNTSTRRLESRTGNRRNLRTASRAIIVALLWLAGALPLLVFGATTNTTLTTSTSSQTGPINAYYVFLEDTIGPGTIFIGARSGCTLVPPPSIANCNPAGGSGTPGDPYQCSSPPLVVLTGCSGGTQFQVLAGTANLNVHTQSVIAVAAAPTQAVPLGPWVPVGSGVGVLLAALLWRRRRQHSSE